MRGDELRCVGRTWSQSSRGKHLLCVCAVLLAQGRDLIGLAVFYSALLSRILIGRGRIRSWVAPGSFRSLHSSPCRPPCPFAPCPFPLCSFSVFLCFPFPVVPIYFFLPCTPSSLSWPWSPGLVSSPPRSEARVKIARMTFSILTVVPGRTFSNASGSPPMPLL